MRNKIFIIIFLLVIIGLPSVILIRSPKTFSVLENRKLMTFNDLKNTSIITNEFQDNLETVLSDQIILGQKIKEGYNTLKNLTGTPLLELIYHHEKENTLIPLAKSGNDTVYKLNKSDYLVYKPLTFKSIEKALEKHVKNINDGFNKYNIETYVFYINKDLDKDIYKQVNDYMKNNLNDKIKYEYFNVLNDNNDDYYNNYKKYFYKTDHHWNYKGSYEGYKIISKMFKKNYLNYSNEVCFDEVKFVGTKGKKVGDLNNYDKFCSYEFDLLKHDVYINRKLSNYGNKELYLKNKQSNQKGINHYALYYGDDYGEIIYDFNNQKDNLLIFSNSYSNAVNDLIASYFNKTYVVDLRAYKEDLGKEFNLENYLKENNIDKVLFLGDINFYTYNVFLINNI